MSGAIYMTTSGALLNERRLELISNNLANINTTGFKQETASFRIVDSPEDIKANLNISSAEAPTMTAPLWQELQATTDYSQGQLKKTGNPLDLALSGKGFFCVQTPDGTRYTRKGNFSLNSEGELVTPGGFPVLGDSGPIKIGEERFSIDSEGNVSTGKQLIGTLRVVDFSESVRLRRDGDTLFATATLEDEGSRPEKISVNQGFLELSNVETMRTMVEMIDVLRRYESYQKAIRHLDEVTAKSINEVGKVG